MNETVRDAAALVRAVRRKGVRGTCRAVAARLRIAERVRERYFEWKLGISTGGIVTSEALGYGSGDLHRYDPSWYGSVQAILRALPLDAGGGVFVDFGSGKGRVLVLAAMYPFRQVIGIERSAALNACAGRNLERARRWMACRRVDIVPVDAATYEIPADATVLYFQNPFSGATLDAVLEHIKVSLMRAPRRVFVVSLSHAPDSAFERQIRRCHWLELHAEVALPPGTGAWIYTNALWLE